MVIKYIFLIGPPGAGKDTLLKNLENEKGYDFMTISVGDCLRLNAETDPDIKKLIDGGNRVEDKLVISLLSNNLKSAKKDYVFINGFPRSKTQALAILDGSIISNNKLYVYNIDVPKDISIQRIVKRNRGADDEEAIVLNRLEDYENTKEDILNLLKNGKNVIFKQFNGHRKENEIFKDFFEELKKK